MILIDMQLLLSNIGGFISEDYSHWDHWAVHGHVVNLCILLKKWSNRIYFIFSYIAAGFRVSLTGVRMILCKNIIRFRYLAARLSSPTAEMDN